MDAKINERMAVAENRLDQNDRRHDSHEERLMELLLKNKDLEIQLEILSSRLEKDIETNKQNYDMLKKMSIVSWVVTIFASVLSAVIFSYFVLRFLNTLS